VALGLNDDPPMNLMIEAALAHLIQSEKNNREARDEQDLATIQRFDIHVLELRYKKQKTGGESCRRLIRCPQSPQRSRSRSDRG